MFANLSRIIATVAPSGVVILVLSSLFSCQAIPDADEEAESAPVTIPPETLTVTREGRNGANWQARLNIGLDANTIRVQSTLHLVPVKGALNGTVRAGQAAWEREIKTVWDDHFALQTMTGRTFPISVAVQFSSLQPDHRILVFPGTGVSRAFRWYLDNPPGTVAHEFGHLLGAYDEYSGGATLQNAEILDPTSVMALPSVAGVAQPRHLSLVEDWFEAHSGINGRIVKWQAEARQQKGAGTGTGWSKELRTQRDTRTQKTSG